MDDTKPKINPLMVPYMLWGALTLSQLFYILVGYAIAQPAKEPVESSLVMVLTGMALFNLGLSVFIRHWLTQPKQLKAQQDPPDVLMEKAFPLPINGLIITWAVAESCALFGFILTLPSGEIQYVVGLSGITIVTMFIVHRPRRLRFDEFR